jgi:phenylacetate-CoA ligase
VYVGEPLRDRTRSILVDDLSLGVFAYYGASETSALGIECQAHDGIHLFTEQNYLELSREMQDDTVASLVVTTLHQEGLPLLRYALGDHVKVRPGGCACGLSEPRVDVVGRTDGSVSLLGVKVSYDGIRRAVYRDLDSAGPIEVVLSDDGREKLTVVLPDGLASEENRIRRSLTGKEPDLAYLFAAKFVDLEIAFAADGHFRGGRKDRRVVDLRSG